ncbi:aminopeptidase [Alicyclobacillus hesperidum]|uniref:aminopeptidase n=1 Tax=Alicyclobacillus hesperidum TaxID=89784 RepID=UPI00058CECBF|nr:aminopeptidase [Alicyclobacillus hesperidum]
MTDLQRKYADLIVRIGVNLQPGQPLVIGYGRRQVYPEHVEFARKLVAAAYDAGASFVQVDWGDEWWQRETVARGDLNLLRERAKWQLQWVEKLAGLGAAYIAIPASDPNLYNGVPADRVEVAERSIRETFRAFDNERTNDMHRWTLASAPTAAWADVVHKELPKSERVGALWQDILKAARSTGDDPIADWEHHIQNLQRRAKWLNDLRIKTLHYRAPGTDLAIELAEGHYFAAAGHPDQKGVRFVANIPTEEVYTAPKKTGVHGTVSSTMPLNHNGSLIEGIRLRFEHGRIVEYHAKKGQDALRGIIEADEGSHYLGEVALVPVDSPIAQMNQIFYNTLFDENASCHLAIGRAYPLVEGGHGLPASEWEGRGLNDSLMHVDFMIGSADLDIDAELFDGNTVPVFRKGRWANGND